jgi:hypothetical protein
MEDFGRRKLLLGALAIVSGVMAWREAYAANTVTLERPVPAFDAIVWDAVGELVVEQAGSERVHVEAEAAVQSQILTEVRGRRLHISIAPGQFRTQQPVRVHVGVRSLCALHTRGAGDVHVGALTARDLELDISAAGTLRIDELNARRLTLHMRGAGNVSVLRGSVDAQDVVLGGSGEYLAPRLASRHTVVRIEGSGNVQVAAREGLHAQILGSGEIGYLGNPRLQQEISGAGRVARLGL